jgi:hypothetical protein
MQFGNVGYVVTEAAAMTGDVMLFKTTTDDETKKKARLLGWLEDITTKMIMAVREDAALRFHDRADDEEVDLKGKYDPIVDPITALRLSDAIAQFAQQEKYSEKMLTRLYQNKLRQKWKEQHQQIPDASGTKFGVYLVNRRGIWTPFGVGAVGLHVWRRIARTSVEPMAWSRDTTRQRNWHYHYQITDETGKFTVEIPAENLGKGADRAITALMRRGVHVVEAGDARKHLAKHLRFKPLGRIIRVPNVGWHEAKGGWVFVTPDETLGRLYESDPAIVLDDAVRHGSHGLHRAGTSEQWRQQIATPLAGNSNVVLAVGAFLAAPLLRWADEPGGGFHFHGYAKIGKTLLGAIGQSVWGKPYAPGAGTDAFGFTWESTTNRIGQRAVQRSDVGASRARIGC